MDKDDINRSDATKDLMRNVMREGGDGLTFNEREKRIVDARLLSITS